MKNYAGAPVPGVGLSNRPNSHAKDFPRKNSAKSSFRFPGAYPFAGQYLELVTYRSGEALLRKVADTSFPDLNKRKPKPREKGERLRQKGITQSQAAKMKKIARFYDHLRRSDEWPSKQVSMLTLSYGREVPDDLTAKRHLHTFTERLRRFVYKKYGSSIEFHHMWCAEEQAGRVLADGSESYRMKHGSAIHFHVVCPYFIPKGWLNDAWNGVVKSKQRLLPNVTGVNKPGNYVSKYLSKEGGKIKGRLTGSSFESKQAVKPQGSHIYKNVSCEDSDQLMDELARRVNNAAQMTKDHVPGRKSDLAITFRPDGCRDRMLWTSNADALIRQMSVVLGDAAKVCADSVRKVVPDDLFVFDGAVYEQFTSNEPAISGDFCLNKPKIEVRV